MGEVCIIYYKKECFKVEQINIFWFLEILNVVLKGWDVVCNRICMYVFFKDLKIKKLFWVFNIYLDYVGNEVRVKGVQLIFFKIKEINFKKYVVFLMGDFNLEFNINQIVEVKKEMDDIKDVLKEKFFGFLGIFNGFKQNELVILFIDYIFIFKNSGLII